MRIFRADPGVDEFTQRGGLYWRFKETQGKVDLTVAGAIVMLVREMDGTVRCYQMSSDFRC